MGSLREKCPKQGEGFENSGVEPKIVGFKNWETEQEKEEGRRRNGMDHKQRGRRRKEGERRSLFFTCISLLVAMLLFEPFGWMDVCVLEQFTGCCENMVVGARNQRT